MISPETRQQRRFKARQERKKLHAKPAQKNAFYRAMTMFKERAEALKAAALIGPIEAKLALLALADRLGQYKSRGKGRGTPMRRYGNRTGAYMPHQGERECLRRRIGGFAERRRSELFKAKFT